MLIKLLTCLFLVSISSVSGLSCQDRDGKPVAWWSLLKFPGNVTTGNPRYAYIDPNSDASYTVISGKFVDDKGEALPNTIEAINRVPRLSLSKLLYSDQPPDRPYSPDGGHAKGIIAYDNLTQSGVYILHSFPRYPNVSTAFSEILYKTPPNTYVYGQNAYCLTLNKVILEQLSQNWPVEAPYIYFSSGIFKDKTFTSDKPQHISQFTLVNGEDQWFLTKNPDFNGFIYEDIILPFFKSDFHFQTWGRPYQDSRCPPQVTYASLNINQIKFQDGSTWDHYSDHSKWAVSVNSNLKISCFCDMNRMDSQKRRGGSCLCSKNATLHQALSKLIVLSDKCPNTFAQGFFLQRTRV